MKVIKNPKNEGFSLIIEDDYYVIIDKSFIEIHLRNTPTVCKYEVNRTLDYLKWLTELKEDDEEVI